MLNTIAFLPPIVPEYDCKGITEPTFEVGGCRPITILILNVML